MDKEIKLCRNCRHFRESRSGQYSEECWRDRIPQISPVDGLEFFTTADTRNCRQERHAQWNIWWLLGDAQCGKKGRFWEPKE